MGLGFDRLTGYAIYAGGMAAGFTAGAANFYSTGIAQLTVGLPLYSGLWYRVVTLFVFLAISAVYLLRYAKGIRKDPSLSYMEEDYRKQLEEGVEQDEALRESPEEINFNLRRKIALVMLLGIFFLNAFGAIKFKWLMPDLAANWLIFTVLLVPVLGVNPSEACKIFARGAASMLPASPAIGLTHSVMVLMNQAKIVDTAVHALSSGLMGKSPILTLGLVFLVWWALISLW